MNLVDLIVLLIIAVSALLGLSRGFVREMLGLVSWVLAGWGAYRFGPQLVPYSEKLTGNPDLAGIVAYGAAFLALLIVLSLASNLVGRIVRFSALGGLDRTLGLVFGVARGAVVLMAAYVLMGVALPPDRWPPQIRQARTVPLIYSGAVAAAAELPEQYRPAVAHPPEDHPLTSDQLLHVNPDGEALGPRPH